MTYQTTDANDLVKELGLTIATIRAMNDCADGYVKHAQSMVDAQLWSKQEANNYLLGMNTHRLYEDINAVISDYNKAK